MKIDNRSAVISVEEYDKLRNDSLELRDLKDRNKISITYVYGMYSITKQTTVSSGYKGEISLKDLPEVEEEIKKMIKPILEDNDNKQKEIDTLLSDNKGWRSDFYSLQREMKEIMKRGIIDRIFNRGI